MVKPPIYRKPQGLRFVCSNGLDHTTLRVLRPKLPSPPKYHLAINALYHGGAPSLHAHIIKRQLLGLLLEYPKVFHLSISSRGLLMWVKYSPTDISSWVGRQKGPSLLYLPWSPIDVAKSVAHLDNTCMSIPFSNSPVGEVNYFV